MKILVDAFGGDKAPEEILKGCHLAAAEFGSRIGLVGDEEWITREAKRLGISLAPFDIHHAPDRLTMEDDPAEILRSLADSSMAVGLKLLAAGEGDAFLSAGNTGALVFGATFLVKRLEGVKRPALAVAVPCEKGCYLLLDAGANSECRPEHLMQFAIMGSVYAEKVLQIPSPSVGLVNVGEEEHKGTELTKETFKLLKEFEGLRFVGNVEARDLPARKCDVAVADGFTGNIVLKLTEGLASTLFNSVKGVFTHSAKTKLAAALVYEQMKVLKKQFDYTEYGGTPLLGIAKPVIKAHGSSNAIAIKNAVRKAELFAGTGVIDEIGKYINKTHGKG